MNSKQVNLQHKVNFMARAKLVLAMILLGASLLVPNSTKADSYCPEGYMLCHPSTTQCCKWVGGRFLKCLPG